MPEKKKITGEVKITERTVTDIKKEVKNILDFKEKVKNSLYLRTTELVEILLSGALYLDASDIHLEPKEDKVKLRIRVDGVLHDILFLDHKIGLPSEQFFYN